MSSDTDILFMRMALDEAKLAFEAGEVPVGAVVVLDGIIIANNHNRREELSDPTAHAELLALRDAPSDSWRRSGTTLYVTMEPCIMCAGVLINARISRLVYGCDDEKAGGVNSLYKVLEDKRLNHQVEVSGGVLKEECAELLRNFFRARRGGRVV